MRRVGEPEVARVLLLVLLTIAAVASPPTPTPSPAGPCNGALASISDRPGLGRAPATNGAACVALPGTFVLEAGYRNQVTVGPGAQTLTTYPDPVLRIGLRGNNELVISPYVYSERTGIDPASGLAPATGSQDAGFGYKHLLHNDPWRQDAINLFVTVPNGYPSGPSGFTAGLPTYSLGYSLIFSLSGRVSVSTTQNLILNAAPDASGSPQRFTTYQPAFSFSYALSPNLTGLLEDQLSIPNAPSGGTSNRALAGFQCTVSTNVVLDAEFELNALPASGLSQHAVGAGVTLLL